MDEAFEGTAEDYCEHLNGDVVRVIEIVCVEHPHAEATHVHEERQIFSHISKQQRKDEAG